jgi:hypothetical protein
VNECATLVGVLAEHSSTKTKSSVVKTLPYYAKGSAVSKKAPNGAALDEGQVHIRGKKEYVRAGNGDFGFGVVFEVAAREGEVGAGPWKDWELDELLENGWEGEEGEGEEVEGEEGVGEEVQGEEGGGEEAEEVEAEAEAEVEVEEEPEPEPEPEVEPDAPPPPPDAAAPASPPKKKGLSAKDRKLIKKYGSLEAAMEAARIREEAEADAPKKPKKPEPAPDTESLASTSTRGGGGKKNAKKMKKCVRANRPSESTERSEGAWRRGGVR